MNSLGDVACLIGGNAAFPYLDNVFGLGLKVQKHFSRNGSLCNGICLPVRLFAEGKKVQLVQISRLVFLCGYLTFFASGNDEEQVVFQEQEMSFPNVIK